MNPSTPVPSVPSSSRSPGARHRRLESGRVAESWFFAGDQYAVDAFWND